MEKVASRAISKIKSLWRDLLEKEVREEYVSARIETDLAHQIYSMRNQRGWTQDELSNRYSGGNSQARISKLETSCEGVTLNTLKKLASAFDVGLSVKFVPFSQMAVETIADRLDRPVPGFDDDTIEIKTPFMVRRISELPTTRRTRLNTSTSRSSFLAATSNSGSVYRA